MSVGTDELRPTGWKLTYDTPKWGVENTPQMGVENDPETTPGKGGRKHPQKGGSDPPFWGGGDILNNVNFGGIHRS
jgi:hypothetical protein